MEWWSDGVVEWWSGGEMEWWDGSPSLDRQKFQNLANNELRITNNE
ncbi:MAG: hypothetical protein K9H16_08295 [Bacteroidales bacterium]|nr:hypothetical protein [Bacteroidales bacterium]